MPRTILIVDDSPTVVKFVSFSLKSKGFQIVSACDGMDAIEKMSGIHDEIDLVITDLNMPNLDGYGFIDTLRQNQKYKDIPIIILTSEDDDKDMEKGIEVGANSYLVKPFKSNVLIEEVSKYLG